MFRSLTQILDAELFHLMQSRGDTHFFVCYRWFLLDFKREFVYADILLVWETIWAANYVASENYVLFLALSLIEFYRDIILQERMNFTDVIMFLNSTFCVRAALEIKFI